MSMSYLLSGVDLLALPCITKADVQQAITQASPTSTIGFVIVSDSAPDVVATPDLARFIWLKSTLGVLDGTFYYYDGASWQLVNLADGSVLVDHSIPINKLSLTGASPYFIIQVNAAGDALQYVSVVNAITNGTVPLNKLVGGGGGNTAFVSLAGVNQFVTIASLVNYFANNTIPIMSLIRGGISSHGLFLRTFEDGTIVEWADFDPNEQIDPEELLISRLSGFGGNAGQSFRRDGTNTGWEWFTPGQPSNNYVVRANGVATGSAIGVGDTNIMNFTLALPASRTWKSFRIAFSTAVDNTVGQVNNFTMRIGADVLTVYATPTGGTLWEGADPTKQQVMYIAEADVHPDHLIDSSLVLSLYAQSADAGGDVIAARTGYAAAEYY